MCWGMPCLMTEQFVHTLSLAASSWTAMCSNKFTKHSTAHTATPPIPSYHYTTHPPSLPSSLPLTSPPPLPPLTSLLHPLCFPSPHFSLPSASPPLTCPSLCFPSSHFSLPLLSLLSVSPSSSPPSLSPSSSLPSLLPPLPPLPSLLLTTPSSPQPTRFSSISMIFLFKLSFSFFSIATSADLFSSSVITSACPVHIQESMNRHNTTCTCTCTYTCVQTHVFPPHTYTHIHACTHICTYIRHTHTHLLSSRLLKLAFHSNQFSSCQQTCSQLLIFEHPSKEAGVGGRR